MNEGWKELKKEGGKEISIDYILSYHIKHDYKTEVFFK